MTAIDTEFRPTSMMSENKIAIVQIATDNNIYILDVNTLVNVLDKRDWQKYMLELS